MKNASQRQLPYVSKTLGDSLRTDMREILGRSRRRESPSFPKKLSQYRLLKEIGAGAKGIVYLARDDRLDRTVAIKVFRGQFGPEAKQRLLREARCAAAVNHANIATIHQAGRADGIDFLVMEYVAGKTLDQVIPKYGLPLPTCLAYALQMAEALAAIHSIKIMHRDLKPANFVVSRETVKLLDFSLAKVVGRRPARSDQNKNSHLLETCEGTILGTPGYMSPEQARGQAADQRSDVFSFGAILYEMLTGRRAFRENTTIETLSAILRKCPPKLPARIPAPIARIVRRCLLTEPSRRYRTAIELAAALTLAAPSVQPSLSVSVPKRARV